MFCRLMMVSDDGERLSVPIAPSRMVCWRSARQPYLRDHSPHSSRSGRCVAFRGTRVISFLSKPLWIAIDRARHRRVCGAGSPRSCGPGRPGPACRRPFGQFVGPQLQQWPGLDPDHQAVGRFIKQGAGQGVAGLGDAPRPGNLAQLIAAWRETKLGADGQRLGKPGQAGPSMAESKANAVNVARRTTP